MNDKPGTLISSRMYPMRRHTSTRTKFLRGVLSYPLSSNKYIEICKEAFATRYEESAPENRNKTIVLAYSHTP